MKCDNCKKIIANDEQVSLLTTGDKINSICQNCDAIYEIVKSLFDEHINACRIGAFEPLGTARFLLSAMKNMGWNLCELRDEQLADEIARIIGRQD